MKVLEERLVYLFTLFCKDLLCSWFHFGSRTFICMCNIFVFPPPLTCCVFFWGLWSYDLFLFSPLIRCECISKCMLDSIWMTKPSSGFVLVFSAICSKTQISLFSCTISFHSPPGLYSQFLVISPNWRWPVLIIWWYSYISTAWFNGFTSSTYPGCLWSHPWFAPSGLFRCCFCCDYLWVISLQHPMDFSSHALMKFAISLNWESHIGLQSRALFFSADQSPGQFTWRLWRFSNLLLIDIPGQIHLYPGWVICAIWINGSELLDPACCDFESDISSRWKRATSWRQWQRTFEWMYF